MSEALTSRLARRTLWVLGGLMIAALVWRPGDWRLALGVAGGGVLIGVSFWGILGLAAALGGGENAAEIGRKSRGLALVKFFTRHAILALAAYGMMTRLHLDPVGLLTGVSAPFVAAAVEAISVIRSGRRAEVQSSKFKVQSD